MSERLQEIKSRQAILEGEKKSLEAEYRTEILKGGPRRLQILLVRNASFGDELTGEERREAEILIGGLPLSDEDCLLCRPYRQNKVIADFGLCRGCTNYALVTRK